jgi:hypothetical protein
MSSVSLASCNRNNGETNLNKIAIYSPNSIQRKSKVADNFTFIALNNKDENLTTKSTWKIDDDYNGLFLIDNFGKLSWTDQITKGQYFLTITCSDEKSSDAYFNFTLNIVDQVPGDTYICVQGKSMVNIENGTTLANKYYATGNNSGDVITNPEWSISGDAQYFSIKPDGTLSVSAIKKGNYKVELYCHDKNDSSFSGKLIVLFNVTDKKPHKTATVSLNKNNINLNQTKNSIKIVATASMSDNTQCDITKFKFEVNKAGDDSNRITTTMTNNSILITLSPGGTPSIAVTVECIYDEEGITSINDACVIACDDFEDTQLADIVATSTLISQDNNISNLTATPTGTNSGNVTWKMYADSLMQDEITNLSWLSISSSGPKNSLASLLLTPGFTTEYNGDPLEKVYVAASLTDGTVKKIDISIVYFDADVNITFTEGSLTTLTSTGDEVTIEAVSMQDLSAIVWNYSSLIDDLISEGVIEKTIVGPSPTPKIIFKLLKNYAGPKTLCNVSATVSAINVSTPPLDFNLKPTDAVYKYTIDGENVRPAMTNMYENADASNKGAETLDFSFGDIFTNLDYYAQAQSHSKTGSPIAAYYATYDYYISIDKITRHGDQPSYQNVVSYRKAGVQHIDPSGITIDNFNMYKTYGKFQYTYSNLFGFILSNNVSSQHSIPYYKGSQGPAKVNADVGRNLDNTETWITNLKLLIYPPDTMPDDPSAD